MSVKGTTGAKIHQEPSIAIGPDYLRLRVAAMEKLPDNVIGYYCTYDPETKILKVKAIRQVRGLIAALSDVKNSDPRMILANDIMRELASEGVREMIGKWDEEKSEFTFAPVKP